MELSDGGQGFKCAFERLPDELLLNIFEELAIHNSTSVANHIQQVNAFEKIRDLAAICQTCKRINKVATPILYQAFVKPRSTMGRRDKSPRRLNNLRPFLRTILQRPDLRRLVKFIHLGPWEMHSKCFEHNFVIELNDEMHEMYSQEVTSVNFGEHQQWVKDLLSGQEDAEVALLLCLLKDIANLSIKLASCSERTISKRDFYFRHVLTAAILGAPKVALVETTNRAPADTPSEALANKSVAAPTNNPSGVHGFKSLRKFSIRNQVMLENECDDFAYPPLSEMLRLPSLESFTGCGVLDYWTGHKNYPTSSGLKAIKLSRCSMPIPAIKRLVGSCAKLETFDLLYDDRMQTEPIIGSVEYLVIPKELAQTLPVTWQGLVDVLHSHRHHLETLCLEAVACTPLEGLEWYGEEDLTEALINNFTAHTLPDFTALKNINMPQIALLSPDQWTLLDGTPITFPRPPQANLVDLLPPGLEALTMTNCTCDLLSHMEDLLARCSIKLPYLRRVQVEPIYLQSGSTLEGVGVTDEDRRLNDLRRNSNAAGITWILCGDPLSRYLAQLEENELETDDSDVDLDSDGYGPDGSSGSYLDSDSGSDSDDEGWQDVDDEDDSDSDTDSDEELLRSNPAHMLALANFLTRNTRLDGASSDDEFDEDDDDLNAEEFLTHHHPGSRLLAALGTENEYQASIDAWVDGWRPEDGFF